jgi:hypothetical protein
MIYKCLFIQIIPCLWYKNTISKGFSNSSNMLNFATLSKYENILLIITFFSPAFIISCCLNNQFLKF